jgi:hypothetical protein
MNLAKQSMIDIRLKANCWHKTPNLGKNSEIAYRIQRVQLIKGVRLLLKYNYLL